ncbi:MAG: trypsin-like peptidase domain-containing protein [Bdellovibrionales bacterium]
MKRSLLTFASLTSLLLGPTNPLALAQVPQRTPPAMKLSDPMPANLFMELSRIINPAVVNISTSQIIRGRVPRDPMLEMLERFYGVPMMPRQNGGPQQMGLGTGFIIREDGLIITNNHVIEGADLIQVQLADNPKLFEAKVIGSDQRTDIALIKIKPDKNLPVAALGSSKDLQVGEWVAAIGNPFGHTHTLTKGIISSIGREIAEINRVPLIQTDAGINPGNSGGPLVNTKGYVIGVNSAIDARGPGIGFAIPIDEVKKILPDLESRGFLRKGYLGIGLGDHNPASAEDLGLEKEATGAVVMLVEKNSPAAKAGLKVYDTIIEVNGKKIKNSVDLTDTIAGQTPNSTVTLKVISPNGKTRTVTAVVAERKDQRRLGKNEKDKGDYEGQKAPHNLGFSVSDLGKSLREDLGLPEDLRRPVIIAVERGSMASLAGVRVGDVVLEVNKQEVEAAADVIKNLKKGRNVLRLARGNNILIITFGD